MEHDEKQGEQQNERQGEGPGYIELRKIDQQGRLAIPLDVLADSGRGTQTNLELSVCIAA